MSAVPHLAPAPMPNLTDGSEAIVNIDRAICELAQAMGRTTPRHRAILSELAERMADLVRMRGEIVDQELRRRGEP